MATAGAYFANPGSSTLLHPTIAHLDEVIFGRADGGRRAGWTARILGGSSRKKAWYAGGVL
jgi:hypothetical protein